MLRPDTPYIAVRPDNYLKARHIQATVYVVDPDKANRDELLALFSALGIEACGFESAEILLNQPISLNSSCLITEINLPGMNGLELMEALRTQQRAIPTILISADGDIELAVRAIRGGAVDFIEKPFIDRILVQRVLTTLEHSENHKNQ